MKRKNLNNSHLIVSCSGGGDSVALAHLAAKYHQADLSIAFIQHLLRGEESLEDEYFLKELISHLTVIHNRKINFYIMDGSFSHSKGHGIESVARAIRHKRLITLADQIGSNSILMGHNLNDHVETFFMKLARGSGPSALGGIRTMINLSGKVFLYRPFLKYDREFLRDFLAAEKIPWRNDSSNESCYFLRNFVRKHVLQPLIFRYGTKVLQRIGSHTKWIQRIAQLNVELITKILDRFELPKAGTKVVLSRIMINELTKIKLSELIHFIWKRENWPAKEITKYHFIEMSKHVFKKKSHINLPSNISFYSDDYVITIGPEFPIISPIETNTMFN